MQVIKRWFVHWAYIHVPRHVLLLLMLLMLPQLQRWWDGKLAECTQALQPTRLPGPFSLTRVPGFHHTVAVFATCHTFHQRMGGLTEFAGLDTDGPIAVQWCLYYDCSFNVIIIIIIVIMSRRKPNAFLIIWSIWFYILQSSSALARLALQQSTTSSAFSLCGIPTLLFPSVIPTRRMPIANGTCISWVGLRPSEVRGKCHMDE